MTDKNAIKPYVLVVEDEEPITVMLQYNLENDGFDVRVETDGEKGFYAALERTPDIILLDWMLPSMTGIDVCRKLRAEEDTRRVPIIMLTARGEEDDRIMGLDSGADDYIVKPFSPKELVARINAVLRRTNATLTEESVDYGELRLDMNSYAAFYKEQKVIIGPTEFRLLRHFMSQPERVFSRDQLLDAVWGSDVYVEIRTVDVHVRRLRKALEEAFPGAENYIRTVRSVGYSLKDPAKGD